MATKGSSEGYVFFNKQRKRWNAQYSEYDSKTGKIKKKTKSFKTEEDAKKYLRTIMYQKENPLYIEHNGIPFCEVMKSHLKLKLDTNQISVKTILQLTGNTSPGLVTMWKNGERQITTKDLLLIANHLGYTVDDLINKDLTKPENNYNKLDNLLFSKAKTLTDEEKKVVLHVIDAIHKDIDKELDGNINNNGE